MAHEKGQQQQDDDKDENVQKQQIVRTGLTHDCSRRQAHGSPSLETEQTVIHTKNPTNKHRESGDLRSSDSGLRETLIE